jgi:hypothetical protein
VRDGLKANPSWGKSTRSLAVSIARAALHHADGAKRLAVNPMKDVRQGLAPDAPRAKAVSRGVPPIGSSSALALVGTGWQLFRGGLWPLSDLDCVPGGMAARRTTISRNWPWSTHTLIGWVQFLGLVDTAVLGPASTHALFWVRFVGFRPWTRDIWASCTHYLGSFHRFRVFSISLPDLHARIIWVRFSGFRH